MSFPPLKTKTIHLCDISFVSIDQFIHWVGFFALVTRISNKRSLIQLQNLPYFATQSETATNSYFATQSKTATNSMNKKKRAGFFLRCQRLERIFFCHRWKIVFRIGWNNQWFCCPYAFIRIPKENFTAVISFSRFNYMRLNCHATAVYI